jgi:cytochrome c-type biogenesis protein
VERLQPGDAFPPGSFENLNPIGPRTIDLAGDLGTRPVVLYYWIAGNRRAEEVFGALEQLVAELDPGQLALYGVAVPREELANAAAITNRLQLLGLRTPVLQDTGFTIGKRVGAETVPHISIIDSSGRLQLTNGISLAQPVGDGDTVLADVIRAAAATGRLAAHGALARYHPVRELEGRPSPDFSAPLVAGDEPRRLRDLLDDSKLNVLVFWSVDCSHCRHELPEINAWIRDNPGDANVVSCARALDESAQARTRQFSDEQGFVFPTLVDRDSSIVDLYRITSTPTILLIGPDGVVQSAIVAHDETTPFAETIERKREELGLDRG